MFINISNHPSGRFDAAQLAAASELGNGQVHDLPFPNVPPEASPEEVRALALDLVSRVPSEARVAMVQGEFSLFLEVVPRLQERGVQIVVATSERDVVEGPDGQKVVRFRFCQFRTLPRVRLAE
mgnify:CR=1 FL=1